VCRDVIFGPEHDPAVCAYITDEAGSLLGVDEIRARIIRHEPLRVADSIHLAYASLLGRPLLKRLYIWYLSKNGGEGVRASFSNADSLDRNAIGGVPLHLVSRNGSAAVPKPPSSQQAQDPSST
jgi:hypothetical protein